LEMLGAEGRLAEDFQISESPAIARRGLAEAFGGSPWSHGDRVETLRFLGLARMNRYVYAPKDDDWREDYAERDLERFRHLLRAAEENFVRFVYVIRPGSSIVYSSEEDTSAIIRKLEAMAALGARGFGLCFDERSATLRNDEDRARFKTLASAQAHLINLVHGRLKQLGADFELYVAPGVTASAQAGGDYLKELGAAIPQDVLFLLSDAGSGAQPPVWNATPARRPVVWDSFAANDDEPWRLFIGPKKRASATLIEGASGFIATASRDPRASMLPIATAADYAWDWRNYNPQQSFDRALNLLYDEHARQGLRVWARLYDDGVFKPLFQQRAGAIDVESMRRRLVELQSATEVLGVTLNQGLLRGELTWFISRAQSAIETRNTRK
jgi:hyaluronoglucosaminidase